MRTLFLTGAEGFVGSQLVPYLRTHGYEVVAGVRNRARKLAYERNQVPALVCDVTDPINVARAIASVRPDGVLHLAGIARPTSAAAEPLLAYQSIVTSWANILDGVRRSVPRARVLLVSACDVYGNAGRDGHQLSETTAPAPISTFGSLKRTAESIAHTFFRDYHLNLTIARPFHYTGPGQPERFFFGAVARELAEWEPARGREIKLPDLGCRRDWLHVADVVTAYHRLLEDGRPNEIYNVCSGISRSCREVVQMLLDAGGFDLRLADVETSAGDGHIDVLCGDNTKLSTELGWSPTHGLEAALEALLEGYRPARSAQMV